MKVRKEHVGNEPKGLLHVVSSMGFNLEADPAHAARINLVGRMAARLTHELTQPLACIRWNADAVRHAVCSRDTPIDELLEIIDDICSNVERADELIRRQRDFLTGHAGPREIVSVLGLLEDVLAFTRRDLFIRQVHLSVDCLPGAQTVLADRVQMQQVLVNLMLNAADAAMHRPQGDRRIELRTRLVDFFVEIRVQDNGDGIAEHLLPRLFDSEVSTKPGGMGLGLKICADIVKAHQGEISAHNNPEGGATFRLLLPTHGEWQAPVTSPQRKAAAVDIPASHHDSLNESKSTLPAETTRTFAGSDLNGLHVSTVLTTLEVVETMVKSAIVTGDVGSLLNVLRSVHRRIQRLLDAG